MRNCRNTIYVILIIISISEIIFFDIPKSYAVESSTQTSCINDKCMECTNGECNTVDISEISNSNANVEQDANTDPVSTIDTRNGKGILWAD